MKSQQLVKSAAGAVVALGVVILAGILGSSSRVQAQADNNEASMIERGFEIAPVPLNLEGKDPDLVGLGSYLVNAVGDCNGCHTGGNPPNFNYVAGRNPYFGQKPKVDPKVYLSGGQDFGPVGTPTGSNGYAGPDMISRNLTPDKTGRPEGGHTLKEFKQIIRRGTDFDHLHPVCTAAQLQDIIQNGATPPCIPTSPDNPVDGNLLQIMPWPTFHNMTDHDMDAIYEYLKAIPCIEGPADPNDPLHNDCG